MKLQLNKKLCYSLYVMLCTIFFSSCGEEIYTLEQCKNFQKGDTIFVKEFYKIEKCVVLYNNPDLEIIEVQNLKYDWRTDIFEYDHFRFK